MIAQHLTVDEMMDSMRAPWIAGDFGAIAREIGVPGRRTSSLGRGSNLTRVCWISPAVRVT